LDAAREHVRCVDDWALRVELLENIYALVFLRSDQVVAHPSTGLPVPAAAQPVPVFLATEQSVQRLLGLLTEFLEMRPVVPGTSSAESGRFDRLRELVAELSWRFSLVRDVPAIGAPPANDPHNDSGVVRRLQPSKNPQLCSHVYICLGSPHVGGTRDTADYVSRLQQSGQGDFFGVRVVKARLD
jgi:hypothetical protein